MKLELQTITLSLLAVGSCNAFAPNTGPRIALSRPGFAIPPAPKTLRLATANGALGDRNADNEVERLRAMAKKLREEATTLGAEQARKVSESTQKAFSKFDLNKDGTISVDELKAGLEKAFKHEITEGRIEKLVDKFDQNGDGILQMDEFVSVDQLRNQLDALIREEKGIELEESKRVQQAEESEKLSEMRMAILNDGEPTTTDKIVSVAPYVLPLLDASLKLPLLLTRSTGVSHLVVSWRFSAYPSFPPILLSIVWSVSICSKPSIWMLHYLFLESLRFCTAQRHPTFL
jgi:hypothetical protein